MANACPCKLGNVKGSCERCPLNPYREPSTNPPQKGDKPKNKKTKKL